MDIEQYLEFLESRPVTKKEKVLLTFPLRPQFAGNTMDYGLGYLYTGLRLAGYDAVLNLDEWKPEDFAGFLKENSVGVVGIKCYGSSTPQIAETIALIRAQSPGTLVLAGGPACYADPENVLDLVPADFAFHGECEESLPLFLDRYFARDPLWADTDGLIRREGSKTVVNKIAVVKDINRIPYAPLNRMRPTPRNVNYYYRDYPNAVVLKSRGCPSRCRFCANSFPYRKRDIACVVEEIRYLKKRFGVRELAFFDNNFNADKRHTRELCRLLIQEGVRVPFNVVHGMRVDTIDEDTAALMAEAGCYKVSLGVESGDQAMLDYLRKGYRAEDLPAKVAILKKHGIQVQAFVMIGLPRETDAQRTKTLRATLDIPFDHVTYNIYTPYPGTELYEELKQTGELDSRGYDLSSYSRTRTDNRLTDHGPAFMRWCAFYYFLRFYLRPARVLATLAEFAGHPGAMAALVYAFYKTYINAD